jgi:hypothetical protein
MLREMKAHRVHVCGRWGKKLLIIKVVMKMNKMRNNSDELLKDQLLKISIDTLILIFK